jgi:glycosyltransferase involved in cell wall biosynthesis
VNDTPTSPENNTEAARHDWESTLSIIIPAFNEEGGIAKVLESLHGALPGAEVIVVDDASTDKTANIVAGFPNCKLVRHPFNQGYGASLKTGMRAAAGTYLAWFDADNEHRVEDLVAMVELLIREKLAAVIGARRNPAPSAIRSGGKLFLRMLARSLGASSVSDMNCGLRVFHRDSILPYLGVLSDKFSASTTSTLLMIDRKMPLRFHPVTLNQREGTSKVQFNDGLAAIALIFRIVLLVAPLRVFLRAGLLFIAVGAVYGLYLKLAVGGPLGTSAVVLTIFGMFLCILGLISDQISQMRLNMERQSVDRQKH